MADDPFTGIDDEANETPTQTQTQAHAQTQREADEVPVLMYPKKAEAKESKPRKPRAKRAEPTAAAPVDGDEPTRRVKASKPRKPRAKKAPTSPTNVVVEEEAVQVQEPTQAQEPTQEPTQTQAKPKKARRNSTKADSDGSGSDEPPETDEEKEDAKDAVRENRDADIVAEKTRMLAQIAEWAKRDEVKRVKKLTLKKSSLDAISDEYYRLKELLGEVDSDDEQLVDDDEAENEAVENEAKEKARMLAKLQEWWAAGAVPKPKKHIDETSEYEAVVAVYEKAAAKLGVDDDADIVAMEAEEFIRKQEERETRKKQQHRMLQQLNAWWADGTLERPPRAVTALSTYDDVLTGFQDACADAGVDTDTVLAAVATVGKPAEPAVFAGRALRNRSAIKRVEDTYLKYVQQEEKEEADREAKKEMVKELRAWVKEGLYSDTADDAVLLKTLAKAAIASVQAEYNRVRLALGMVDEADLAEDADNDADEDDEDEEEDSEEDEDGTDEDDDSDFEASDEEEAVVATEVVGVSRKRLRKASSSDEEDTDDGGEVAHVKRARPTIVESDAEDAGDAEEAEEADADAGSESDSTSDDSSH